MKAYIANFTGYAEFKHNSAMWSELIEKANYGTLTTDEKKRIDTGEQKLMGWLYNFRPVMRRYVVKTAYYLQETYAFNKTIAREQFKGLGAVEYIVEVPNPWRK
jgi:hypothetical protein